jgi:tetratricopeptide (TPR) repeat protein
MREDSAGVSNELSGTADCVLQVGNVYGGMVVTASRPPLVPRQVPPGPPRFVNREEEQTRVGSSLVATPNQPVRVTLVRGLPGVGKSALVSRLVELRGDGFAGGELYVDFDGPSASVADKLAACLRALGVGADVMPAGLDERTSWYRTLTSLRPTLVVLDNVTDPAQVAPFVPKASGSAVVVVSVGRLTELVVDGAEVVVVEPLDAAKGAHLVAELSGRELSGEAEATAELVEQCGGLPMALKPAAARLRLRASLRVSDLVDEIAATGRFSRRGEDQVSAVFAVSYRYLPTEVARLYRSLAALPCPDFDADLATATAALPAHECRALLDELVEAGLLTERADGRFQLHQLVAWHARERGLAEDGEHELTHALRRAGLWLLVRAACADRAVLGTKRYRCTDHDRLLAGVADPFADTGTGAATGTHADGRARALAWLDAERPTLLAMTRAAAEHGWHDLAWQLAEASSALYVTRRYLVDWTESGTLGAKAAALANATGAEARLRSFTTRAWTSLGEREIARTELAAALPLAERTGDRRLIASVWELVGRFHDGHDFARAADAFGTAIELFTGARDQRGVAFVSYFLGASQLASGDHETALRTLTRALELIREVGDPRMEGRALTTLGLALDVLADIAAAQSRLREAIAVLTASGDSFYEAQAQEALGRVAEREGDDDRARIAFGRALEIHAASRSPRSDELAGKLRSLSEPSA